MVPERLGDQSNADARLGGTSQPLIADSRAKYRSVRGSLAISSRVSSFRRYSALSRWPNLAVYPAISSTSTIRLLRTRLYPVRLGLPHPFPDQHGHLVMQAGLIPGRPLGRLMLGHPADPGLEVGIADQLGQLRPGAQLLRAGIGGHLRQGHRGDR
ncbi:hypothetical protein [Microbispora sp. NPDC049125]|uniref:hypothetical protein n=1 Tax=Microbispora sp. NPDC049125 TaxID=3154929 RepID=UPI0034653CC0